MVLALVGDSTTTTSMATQLRRGMAGRVDRPLARAPRSIARFSPRAGRRGCRADGRCGPPAPARAGRPASQARLHRIRGSVRQPRAARARARPGRGRPGPSGARRAVSPKAIGRRSRQTRPSEQRRRPIVALQRAEDGQDVGGTLDQMRAVAEELVGATMARIHAGCPAPPSPRGHGRAARRAVISEPDAGAASTTTTPSDEPGDHADCDAGNPWRGRWPRAGAR